MMLAVGLLLFHLGSGAIAAEPAPRIQEAPTGRPFAARVENFPGIKNVAKVAQGIYRGGQPGARGYRALRERGFKTIISLREHHDEGAAVRSAGLRWIHIPLHADVTGAAPPTREEVRIFMDSILDPQNQPVFFHCALGKDRTGTMAAIYRMEVAGWTPEEALREMEDFGAHGIYKSLTRFIKNYKPSRRPPAAIDQ